LNQTPIYNVANPDILELLPQGMKKVIDVGSSSGALAKAYKQSYPGCEYIGIEINKEYAALSARFCNRVILESIENVSDRDFNDLFPSDCWIFGDTLEHLYDPWAVLKRIRKQMSAGACIVACIPNAQHWSVQAYLNSGQFRYQDNGLFDRTHIRWFTRITINEMFETCGYKIVDGKSRSSDDPNKDRFLPSIRSMAQAIGIDPDMAERDSLALQWVVKAIPV
jgi:cyclopropane fatty-acyl-phospholipid synthase-like methyltransferase